MGPPRSVRMLWCACCLLAAPALARYPPLHAPRAIPVGAPRMPLGSFLRPASAPSPSGMPVTVEQHVHHVQKELIFPIILASVAVMLLLFASFSVLFCWRRNRQKRHASNGEQSSGDDAKVLNLGPILSTFNSLKTTAKRGSVSVIDYKVMDAATNNFAESNILGEGGFGCVYKACMDDGILVAVKKLDSGGQDCEREFENEMDLLCRIRHSNVVSLLGYSINGKTRLLVYELMQNGSLESQLHGPSHGSALTWHIRMKIALDAARGLEYLHEHCSPPVIHRDLKSSNILLDSEFNAKISDFGLAVTGHSKGSVKLSGTLGYVAPEYILDGKLTEKSDVYAFGVVLLELLIGRKPVEKIAPSQCQSIVTWAMPQLTDRSKLPNIVDPMIRNTMDPKHLYQVAAVAVLCVQPEPSYRPLITDVLHSLIPLVPIELGGTLRVTDTSPGSKNKLSVS